MTGFSAYGKEVKSPDGARFADAVSEVGALLIVAALNWRKHHPVANDDEVYCGRCQSRLPDEGDEPCVPRAPRCPSTGDLFESVPDAPNPATMPEPELHPRSKRRPQRKAAVR